MHVASIENAREKRQRLSRAANHLAKARAQIDFKRWVSSEQLSQLPDWCAFEMADIRQLQRICGAFYFAPQIETSIDGNLLRALRDALGEQCFASVRSEHNMSHRVSTTLGNEKLPLMLMQAGSGVLLATLNDAHMWYLFEQLIGDGNVRVDTEVSVRIIQQAIDIFQQGLAVAVEQ